MLKDFASAGLKMKTLSVLLVVFGKETPTADRLRDLDPHPDATGQALIRRGKTDLEGQGMAAYLSRETVRWLKVWIAHAQIKDGALFRRLIGRNQICGALNPGSIALVFKRVAQWIGMPERFVAQVSGHSGRVGAAQDLAELDIDLAAITQGGGVEVDADAAEICGEDQCGKIRYGEGGRGYETRQSGL
jgi:hypothetical protein